MKKVIILIMIVSLLISGCQLAEGRIEASDSAADELIVTADPVTTSNSIDTEPSETSVQTESSVSEVTVETSSLDSNNWEPMNIDYSFDDIMYLWNDYIGISMDCFPSGDNYCYFETNSHCIQFIQDYCEYIDYLVEISNEGADDDLPESDFHILRVLAVDGVQIFEYDDAYWASVAYGRFVENAVSSNIETIDSSHSNGYCFTYDTSIRQIHRFAVCYFFGNCIIAYDYNVNTGHTNEYEKYLELCNVLGLPTSDQITDIVLHN